MMNHQNDAERINFLLLAGARVSRNIATILDLPQLLSRIVDLICEEFGFYYAGVFLVDETGQYAVLKASYGEAGRTMLSEGHKLLVGGHSMIGAAIEEHHARISLDVGGEDIFFRNPHLPGTRSEMALPLVVGDEAIGALTVQSEVDAAFTEGDIAAMQTLADQLAVAIQNARLHFQNLTLLRQSERRARLLRAANTVGKEATSVLLLEDLLPLTINTIVDSYGFYYAGIFLVDATGYWAELRAAHGEAGKKMLAEGHRLEIGGNSMIGACIRLNEARIALDVGGERVFYRNPHLPNTRSEMALPLSFGGETLGAVTVQSVEERAFSQDDITTLQTMADHLSIAIRNAYALQELEKTHAELLRTKIYEALTVATTEAIHWIGNKALPITMTTDRLKEELSESEPDLDSVREDIELIAESAGMIVAVKEQLIGQAREQQPRPVLLADVLQAAAKDRHVPAGILRAAISPGAAYVMADSTQLARALGNLLQNAVEAGAGHISLAAERRGASGTVTIILSDNGVGMTPEVVEKAWSPFFTTKGAGHTGLGLPAALHVISQLMGNIQITSSEGGTSVIIDLPAALPQPFELKNIAGKIQLIDDDDEWAQWLSAQLGARLSRSLTPDTAVDLILVDEYMQTRPLDQVLASISAAGLKEKTVLVTAALHVDRLIDYLSSVRDVTLKPYSLEELSRL